jgi:hypothetical protein
VRTHYEVLGVARTATTAQIREAFRAKARTLHPDRLIDASPRERDAAARDMQMVSEAWRVLGDGRRRRAYDESLVPSGSRGYAETTLGDEDWVDAGPHAHAPLLRGLPWIVLAAVLLLIFVFTAYAGPDDASEPAGGGATSAAAGLEVGDCVRIRGDSVDPATCAAGSDGQVVAIAAAPSGCPPDTRALVAPGDDRVLCVAR